MVTWRFALIARSIGPTGLTDVAIHIPLDEGNVGLSQKPINVADDVVLNVGAGHIQNELIARWGSLSRGEMDHPIGMGAIQIAVRVDHFRFNPQPEIHT